jgi:glycosyltransferase involved in cell wall biosynthesis
MAEAEAMISTSRFEGYPAVMVEALVAGTFVIAGRSSCAIDDILQSPLLGCTVEDSCPEAFARAIRNFLASPQRHAHGERRALARSLFSSHLDAASARKYLTFMRVDGRRDSAHPHSPLTPA